MSNKTSDKNVANEERLNNFIEAYKQTKEQSFIVDSINKDFFFEFVDCLLAEREQNKKRIQELEEENAMLKKASNIARDVNIEKATEVMNKSYEEFMSNYINKQKVIDLMEKETIDISGFECVAVEDLQELLEGERK